VDEVRFATEDWHHVNPFGGVDKGLAATLATAREVHPTFLKSVTDTPASTDVRFATDELAVTTVSHGVREPGGSPRSGF
jgi:hypothetical protein